MNYELCFKNRKFHFLFTLIGRLMLFLIKQKLKKLWSAILITNQSEWRHVYVNIIIVIYCCLFDLIIFANSFDFILTDIIFVLLNFFLRLKQKLTKMNPGFIQRWCTPLLTVRVALLRNCLVMFTWTVLFIFFFIKLHNFFTLNCK